MSSSRVAAAAALRDSDKCPRGKNFRLLQQQTRVLSSEEPAAIRNRGPEV